MYSGTFQRSGKPELISRQFRRKIWHRSVIAHVLALFLPMSLMVLAGLFTKREEQRIRVSFASAPSASPSSSRGDSGSPAPKPPPKTKPRINPKPVAQPKVRPVKPRINPKPAAQPKVRPVKPRKPTVRTKPRPVRRPAAQPTDANRPSPSREFQKLTPRELRDMNRPGSPSDAPRSNAPRRDIGGRPDAKFYAAKLVDDIRRAWILPPSTLVGADSPEVHVELDLAADGRVISTRITRRSGNPHVDESVRRMLEKLFKVTPPPEAGTIELILEARE